MPKLVPVDLTPRKITERKMMRKEATKVPLYVQSYVDVSFFT
jgi:hypothetical protein